jgi:2-oxoglutarate dehydrogenase E1 component
MNDQAYFSGNAEYLEALSEHVPESPPASTPLHFPQKEALSVSDLPLLHCETRQVGVLQLINSYRMHGFRIADLDPLKRLLPPHIPELDPANHGLTPADLNEEFETGSLAGPPRDSLRNIVARLKKAYCGTLGPEYMHLTDTQRRRWLQRRTEGEEGVHELTARRKLWLIDQLTAAETLEKVIHTRYVGQKRFSLEGGESLIVLLNYLIEIAARAGVMEIGLGMAHRGRLNVLHNVLGRSAIDMFASYGGQSEEDSSSGDVKYHQGYARELETRSGPIRVALAFNPSHLEIVDPVVEGWVRAQQQRRGDRDGSMVMPVVVHGDAAFSAQGVVMETLNMAATRGFSTGGTIHVVVNNQIGFTTSDPRDSRSTLYCTDVMKMVDAPVLHVNGDDPEAVLKAVRTAFDYRMTFKHDIAIDLVCFRRLGHNEQDEPMVTQPLMYRRIRSHAGVREIYADKLAGEGLLGPGQAEEKVEAYRRALDAQAENGLKPPNPYTPDWSLYKDKHWRSPAATAVPLDRLKALGARVSEVPEGFTLHPRVIMVMGNRRQMAEGSLPLDWGMAETLAYAALLTEGHGVRLSGQDSGRGTFFHRQAVLHDQNRERWDAGIYVPLQHLAPDQAKFLVVDSLLSEEAVLGYEYGYASAAPDQLIVWEAQFGDFVNGAQVVVDQFIAAAEAKWSLLNGLTLFLPHGYEGQGPEHSSARIERFLQLAAQDNLQVVQPSMPAQMFHVLRRQVLRPYRKPLILFTPKSLLRHPDSSSPLSDLAQGQFQTVVDDTGGLDPKGVKRLVICSGRLYFDLVQRRKDRPDIAILRIEQLYPFPDAEIEAALVQYVQAQEIVWVQDEPKNQGPWRFMAYHLRTISSLPIRYVGRPPSASPATGFASVHKAQLERILEETFQG